MGVRGSLLLWLKAFLINRRQRVIYNDDCSRWINVSSGVPKVPSWVHCYFWYTLMILVSLSNHLLGSLQMIASFFEKLIVEMAQLFCKRILNRYTIGVRNCCWHLVLANVRHCVYQIQNHHYTVCTISIVFLLNGLIHLGT